MATIIGIMVGIMIWAIIPYCLWWATRDSTPSHSRAMLEEIRGRSHDGKTLDDEV